MQKPKNCSTKEDILVSIIITESTASLLELDVPHIEEVSSCHSQSSALNNCRHIKRNGRGLYLIEPKRIYEENDESEEVAEIAFFTKNALIDTDDSLSSFEQFDDLSQTSISSAISNVLEPVSVRTRAITAIGSAAHKEKIKCEKNKIYVSVLDNELTITDSGWINVCRICHGGESVGNLLSPCRCRGSIALAHIACLERWLKESEKSHCELCQHHYQILREPKYSIPMSILLFLRYPGEHFRELVLDFVSFLVYTPSALTSTYMLMLLCESIAKNGLQQSRVLPTHAMAFTAIFGMAAIDFTYSSWLMITLQKHYSAWREWYKNNCNIRIILPKRKQNQSQREDEESIDTDEI